MNETQFNQMLSDLQGEHGAVVGTSPTDPYVKDKYGVEKPNPNPTYRYVFGDGTYVDAIDTGTSSPSYNVTAGTALKPGPAEKTSPILRDTDTGLKRYNPDTGSLEPVPGGEAPIPIPNAPSVSTSAQKIPVWDEQTKAWGWQDNPNYVAPREPAPPQGPAFSGTAGGMQFSSDLALRNQLAVQAQQDQAALDRIKAQGKQAIEFLAWKRENGYEITPREEAELKMKLDQYTAEYKAYVDETAKAKEWNAELPGQRWAQEQQNRNANQQKMTTAMSGLKAQADTGQAGISELVRLGVAPGNAMIRMAYDPMAQIQSIISRMAEQGQIPPDMIPKEMQAPVAPQAPVFGQAPVAQLPQAPTAPLQ